MAIFLLTYGSHDMRHTGFPQVDNGQWGPQEMGRIAWYQSLGTLVPRA